MGKAKVLFVDDEPKVLRGLQRTFHGQQYLWDMTFVPSGTEALQLFEQNPFDIVVTDLSMPEISGLELVRQINNSDPDVLCIVLTGTADLQMAETLINSADVFRFYTKPCDSEKLIEGIFAGLTSKKRTRDNNEKTLTATPFETAVLDKIPIGVFVSNANGHVFYMNTIAAQTVVQGSILTLDREQCLRATTSDTTDELHDLLRKVIDSTSGETRGISLNSPHHEIALRLILTPMDEESNDDRRAMIFLTDTTRTPLPNAQIIRELFDLTNSESRLVERLVRGDKVDEACVHLGLTVSTARTYLKRILSKLAVRRQSELVGLVLSTYLPTNK